MDPLYRRFLAIAYCPYLITTSSDLAWFKQEAFSLYADCPAIVVDRRLGPISCPAGSRK